MKKKNEDAIIAIIPARGGSKGIPRKNIKIVAGKPLIAYTIEQVLSSKFISHVFVTTDDNEIAAISKSYGAEVCLRPAELASDTSTSETAILHCISEVEKNGIFPTVIVFLQCTSPIRRVYDIDNAIKIFINKKADSLLTVNKSHRFLWKIENDQAISVNYDYHNRRRRQEMPDEYAENGSFYIFKTEIIKQYNNRLAGKTILYVMMDYWSSIEIDCEEDLQICDKILTQRALQNNINRLPDKVGLLALDFDGVFTDNKVIINENGIESVIVDRGDGMGIASIKKLGIPIAVISTEHNSVVRARCKKLDIECIQGIDDKVKVFQKYISDKHIDPDSTIYVGNDINDIDCIKAAKCGVAVANAHAMLKEIADITLSHSGGSGAIREICDLIIRKMDNG